MTFLLRRVHLVSAMLVFLMWATPASAGVLTLAWNPNTEPDIAGYRLRYGTVSGSHTNVVDVGNRTAWQVRGLADGQRFYFVVTAYNYWGLESAKSAEVSATVVGLVTLLSNFSSPSPTGQQLTWTAMAGPSTALEYKFYRFSQAANTWTVVRDYASSNTFSWTPSSSQQGTYTIQVWVRLQGSSVDYHSWASSDSFVVGNGPVKIGSVEASIPLPVSTGTPISWTARAVGGPAPLQYKFYRFNLVTRVWTMAQDYSTSDTVSWTPGPSDEGQYYWQVWVKGNGSSAVQDAWRNSDTFRVDDGPVSIARLTANVAFPAGTGGPITWTAEAAGGPGGLQYEFRRTGSSSATQSYGPSNKYTWTPTSTGTYAVEVRVRRVGSTAAYEDRLPGSSFQIANSMPASVTIESSSGPVVGTGMPVTWTARATGGPAPLQYKFWLYEVAKDSWTVLRDWSATNTASWTPGQVDAGQYNVQVWVRRQGSSAVQEAYTSATISVAATVPGIHSITTNVGTTTSVGTPIVLTAKPSGGMGRLEYQFWRQNKSTGTWVMVQDYSWDNSFGWVPRVGEAGAYQFQVWVRRSGSTAAQEGWGTLPNLDVNP